jgi:hypothetical protein
MSQRQPTNQTSEKVKEQYEDKLSNIREENDFSGGSLICKYIKTGDGKRYGKYAYLVSPPSAGREWHYVGKCATVDSKPSDAGNNKIDSVEFEEIERQDAPIGPPESRKLTYTQSTSDGEVKIVLNMDSGNVSADLSGAFNIENADLTLRDDAFYDKVMRLKGEDAYNNPDLDLDDNLFEEIKSQIDSYEDEYASYQENITNWIKEQDLVLKQEEVEVATDRLRRIYTDEEVMRANKAELSEEEMIMMNALREKFGTTDVSSSNRIKDERVDVPDRLSLGEAYELKDIVDSFDVSEEVDEKREEHRLSKKRENIADEYPDLDGLIDDPDETRSKIESAKEDGDRKLVASEFVIHNKSGIESDTATIKYYVNPDGEIEEERAEHF